MVNEDINNISEREYRLLLLRSYSSVKDFLQSRLKYYKKYILLEKVEDNREQDGDDIRFGSIVDCLKFTPEEFEDKYQISTSEKPSGQMLSFVEELGKLTKKNTNDFGVVCCDIDLMLNQAYDLVGFKRDKLETIKEKFLVKKEGYDYYLELKDRGDKIVITTEELQWAQGLVEYMNKHPHTRDIMNLVNGDKYKIIDQLKLKGVINGMEFKMMSDRVVFNEIDKVITPLDLKVMGNNEMFPFNYLKLKYYIQNAVYVYLLRQNFPDYKVKPLAFITIDKYRQNDPVIVRTTEKQFQEALNGFSIDGRKYKGLFQAIEELKWHEESGIWTTSKEIHDGKGFIDLRLNNYEE